MFVRLLLRPFRTLVLLVPVVASATELWTVSTTQTVSHLQAAATDFLQHSPVPEHAAEKKHIPVLQGEFALVSLDCEPQDGVVVSSDQATTCLILVAHCISSQQVLAAHIDKFDTATGDDLQSCMSQMRSPKLYLVGSYEDSKDTGQEVLEGLLSFLHAELDMQTELCLFCCSALNTSQQQQPLAQGLAYCTATRTAFIPIQGMYPGKYSSATPSNLTWQFCRSLWCCANTIRLGWPLGPPPIPLLIL